MLFRYSRWDGSQNVPDFSADDVLDDIADDILGYGDLKTALQRLMNQGLKPPQGERTPGLRDRLFTEAEQRTPSGNERTGESLAARFAAKEALAKALGAPGDLHWHDAEVMVGYDGMRVV